MRLALLLLVIEPAIGGVLIQGVKGTAKSTMARSLAALLPSGRLRTLALGATEDRLVGGLEWESVLTSGSPRFMQGLLAEADGGVVYVDEVNLLSDHLVDALLDAAASGVVVTEREGLSRSEPARFALIGTMNPEEGALRPQLLDRFGLCVQVEGIADLAKRVEILTRRLAYDADPAAFRAAYADQEAKLAGRLRRAREASQAVELDNQMTERIAVMATAAQAAGHRAELVMSRAARAHAAWCGRRQVTVEDLETVAELALCHRRRSIESPDRFQPSPAVPPRQSPAETASPEARSRAPDAVGPEPQRGGDFPAKQVAAVGEPFKVRSLKTTTERGGGSGSGRRATAESTDGRGRYIRARPTGEPIDLALDATLRAAAVHQRHRRRESARLAGQNHGPVVSVKPDDWRRKVRVRQTGSLVVLCVDASGSMGARNRMVACKGAVLSLLLDAYVKRDQVALVSFRGVGARVLVDPTSSIEAAERQLRELPVGGRTPLAAGLVKVSQLLRRALLRDPTLRPLVIVVTDGRGNVDLSGRVSRAAGTEAIHIAARLAHDNRATWVVVDTEPTGSLARGHGAELAAALGARRFAIEELRTNDLVLAVQQTRSPARKEHR